MAILVIIAIMGAALASTGSVWRQIQQRENEQELLFVGLQYRRAIARYYERSPGVKSYPPTLDALLHDERLPGLARHLRRPYRDPMTHAGNWGLVPAPTGGIMGVYSLAAESPIRRSNYPSELGWLGGKPSYADWQFIYLPAQGP